MDEQKLIERAAAGGREEFAKLYSLYRDRLYRCAFFKLKNESDAQDAVSECVVRAFERIHTLRNAKAFPAWIFKILYRCCSAIESERSKLQDAEPEEKAAYTPPQTAIELAQALELLSPEDRDIVLLSTIAGFNSRELSDITGIKASTIRSRLARSLKKMREFLE